MNKYFKFLAAIKIICPAWDESIHNFDWDDSTTGPGTISIWRAPFPKPSQAQIDAAMITLAAQEAASAYKGKRTAEYPPPADWLDAWVKNDVAGMEAYRAACLAVKAKYPK